MHMRSLVCRLGLFFLLVAVPALGLAQERAAARKVIQRERVVAGGPKDFMEVSHIVLSGTNEEIGRALATIGKERFGLKPEASADRLRARVLRRYLEKNYPALHERMRGVAAAFGKRLEEDSWDFSGLPYLVGVPGGCSVVHFPPSITADGKSVVSRGYDFTTGTVLGGRPPRGVLPATARPYLIELHPERGYSSLALCAYDLLSGVIDGINSEGLTVTMMADAEYEESRREPTFDSAVGLSVMQVARMLLDTCANVGEAKEALLTMKQYYEFIPVHYLVADCHGKAFVWERSHSGNRDWIIEDAGKPLICENFALHRHLQDGRPPSAQGVKGLFATYAELGERLAAGQGKLTVDFIKQCHRCVDATQPSAKDQPPVRTLWHALYYPEQRKVQVSFYLRDEPDPKQSGTSRIVRSEYVEIVLVTKSADKKN